MLRSACRLSALLLLGYASAFTLDYFGPRSPAVAWELAGAAIILLAASDRGGLPLRGPESLGLLLVGGLSALAWPLPELRLLAVAGAGGLLALRWPPLRRLSSAAALAALALLALRGLFPLWCRFEASRPSFHWLESVVAGAVRLAGGDAATDATGLRIDYGHGGLGLAFDCFKLGGFPVAGLVMLDGVLSWRDAGARAALRRIMLVGGMALVAGVLRVLSIHASSTLGKNIVALVEPAFVIPSQVPMVLALAALGPAGLAAAAALPAKSRRLAPGLVAFPAIALAAFCLAYVPAGEPRGGAVLIDESHSTWESTLTPFDRENFGRGTTYNYAMFADLVRRYAELRTHREGAITPAVLEGVQVAILKTPTRPFAPEETKTLLDFVRSGGGLWLVGDHTNLYGMADTLNALSAPCGFRYVADATFDLFSGWTTFERSTWPVHPIARESDGLAYQTSCSLETLGPGVDPVFYGHFLASELADYGHPNFFGNVATDFEDRFGTMFQGVATSYGSGRVVGFSDSTILSNFALHDRGVSEMCLRTIAFLGRSSSFPKPWRAVAFTACILVAAIGLSRLRASLGGVPTVAWACLAAAALAGGSFGTSLGERAFAAPAAREPYRDVAFVESASTFRRSAFIEEAQNSEGEPDPAVARSISTFYTWVLRIPGMRPRMPATVEEAVASKPAMIVVFEPRREPANAEMEALVRYVLDGGVLLVADDIQNARGSCAQRWTRPFGLSSRLHSRELGVSKSHARRSLSLTAAAGTLAGVEFVADAAQRGVVRPGEPIGTTRLADALLADGGTPLLSDDSGSVLAAAAYRGRGLAVLFTCSSMLTNDVLGGRFDPVPGPETLARQKAVIDLAEFLLSKPRAAREPPR